MAKITTMKFNDQLQNYGPYTENPISEQLALALSSFIGSMKQYPGFYKHVITFQSGVQISFLNSCINPIDLFEHRDKIQRIRDLNIIPSLHGIMILSLEDAREVNEIQEMVSEFYNQHSNIDHGNTINETA